MIGWILGALGAVVAAVFLLGVATYILGRAIGRIAAPEPATAWGLERLGAARLVMGALVLFVLLLNSVLSEHPSTPLNGLLVVGVVIAASWASPANVTFGLGWWACLVGTGLLSALHYGAEGLQQTEPLRAALWVALAAGAVSWLARWRWAAAPPPRSPARPALVAAPAPPPFLPLALAPAAPQPQAKTVRPAPTPETIIGQLAGGFVGQPRALADWLQTLHRQHATFTGHSSRAAVVIHAGGTGCGRRTLAVDVAAGLGLQPSIIGPGEALPSEPLTPFVIIEADGAVRDRDLANIVTSGARWQHAIVVVLAEVPHVADLVDEAEQAKLRAALAGTVHPELAAVAMVMPFRQLDPVDLGAVAVRLLDAEGRRLRLTVTRSDPEVAAAIVRGIPANLRDGGAAGLVPAMTVLLGPALDNARAAGCLRVTLHLHGGKIAVAPSEGSKGT